MAILSAADIIDRSWELYQKNAVPLLLLSGVLLVPDLLITLTLVWGMPALSQSIPDERILLALSLVLYIPMAICSVWASVALMRGLAEAIAQRPIMPAPLLRSSLSLIPRTLVGSCALVALFIVGTLLFVVPGIIVYVWFAFMMPAIALNNATVREAFRQSRDLVAGRFVAVLWRLFAPHTFWFLLTTVLVGAFALVMNGLHGTWTIRMEPQTPHIVIIAVSIFESLVRAVVLPLITGSLVLLYASLKQAPAHAPAGPV